MRHPASTATQRIIVILWVILLPSLAAAQTPRTIGFQGSLSTPAGDPVPDAVYTIRFAIYDDEVGGSTMWSETKDVATVGGTFSTELGSDTTITGFPFDTQLWLGLRIETDPEIVPRTKLTGVPIALSLALGPKMTYTSISAAKFSPSIVDNTSWYSASFVDAYIEEGPANNMVAAVDLPDGAELKEFSAYLFDTSTDNLSCTLYMYHYKLNGTTETLALFSVESSGTSGRSWYTDSTINASAPPAVDNSRMTFSAYCESIGAGWTTVNSDVRISQVVVGYQAASP